MANKSILINEVLLPSKKLCIENKENDNFKINPQLIEELKKCLKQDVDYIWIID